MIIETANEEEWLKERMNGIGASEAPIIMGVSQWQSRGQLWAQKVTGGVRPKITSDAIDLGHLLEVPLLQLYTMKTGHQVVHEGQVLYASDEHDFIRASPDARGTSYGAPGIVEVKTTTQDWKSLPYHVWIQVQQQLYVREEDIADVIALTRNRPRIWTVPRDQRFIDKLVAEEIEFWESVQNRTRPASIQIIKEAGEGVELPRQMSDMVGRLIEIKEAIKELKERESSLVDTIKAWAQLEGAEEILSDGVKVAKLSEYETTRLDTSALKADHPELVEQYMTSSTSTRLTLYSK